MELRDTVAIVTGASSGIGEAIARELSTLGVRLVLTARREERLAALAASLPSPSVTLAAAIEAPDTPAALLGLALKSFGRADILINNAGIFVAARIDTADLDELSQMMRVNFDAVVRGSYVLARHFKAQGHGAIINVSSVAAYISSSSVGVYSGLKHALEVFTSALRVELNGTGVRVGTVAPGTTETEIFDKLRARGAKVGADGTPALDPADIAAAVRFMLEQPDRANVARMLVVSASESV
ncbi:SDR family oxidoreductase [Pelomonas sp. KK5]|uniref:SDR family oxidoreductase n=1 Tax=Pelomonas sp. KK5 TaxID=1855730 RepID=UPI00097C7ABD|nr:SDR family oxidoreductase [Pelomonas sp. KK5]